MSYSVSISGHHSHPEELTVSGHSDHDPNAAAEHELATELHEVLKKHHAKHGEHSVSSASFSGQHVQATNLHKTAPAKPLTK